MTPPNLFLLPLYLACLPSATAWMFSWTTPDDQFLTSRGNDVKSCQQIDNPVGNVYDWDPKGDNLCIFFYNNTDCTDPSAGYTCSPWAWPNHKSKTHVLSYEITKNDSSSDSSSETGAASTATLPTASKTPSSSASSSASSAASTSSGAAANQDTSSALSGGAIAGIVVGVVAGIAIAGLLLFFFLWRRRKQSASTPTGPSEPGPGPVETAAVESKDKYSELPSPNQGYAPAEKSASTEHVRELPASHTMVSELGAGVPRAELDGSSPYTPKP